MSSNNKVSKICIISMTYNRPEYIKRSFDSLYARAGMPFTHYVFDDCSDDETQKVLSDLKTKYKFNLIANEETLGIYKNFRKNTRVIPTDFDFYVKFDSDIEVLSDNLFQEMLEVFGMQTNICGATPKVEGVYNAQRVDARNPTVQFFNGHAIKLDAPVVYGCCLVFTKKVFESFPKLSDIELAECKEQWGVDSILYEHSLKFGKFIIVEDLSVYHIDNSYGQRKRNMRYFTARNRWGTIDKDEVWYLRLSKDIYPQFADRGLMELLKRSSADNYESFIKACKSALTHGILEQHTKTETMQIVKKIQETEIPRMTLYRVSAPPNFVGSKNLERGKMKYFRACPEWTRKDSGVVVETITMPIVDAEKLVEKEPVVEAEIEKHSRVRRKERRTLGNHRRLIASKAGRADAN